MPKAPKLSWTDSPAEHDYPSAASYLRLVAGSTQVEVQVALLAQASTVQQHAKDILGGYHRVCASYHLNEDADVACRLVELPAIAV